MPSHQSALKRAGTFLLFWLTLLSITVSAFAQSGLSVVLYPPDLESFPKIRLYLDAYDTQGKFIPTLDLNSFRVFEDGFERVVNETRLLEPGLHSIIAFNLGATLSNRKNAAVPTRYEEVVFALASWLNRMETDATNKYSLTSNEGILVDRLQEKDAFTFQLQNYKPNLFNFQPDFNSLSLAMDIAEQPDLNPQGKTSILYITPLPLDQALGQLPTMRARAVGLRVPVNIWLVAPETAANAPAVDQLRELAFSTGGSFLFFGEEAAAPDPEDYVGRLRNLYEVVYTSDVNQSGPHTASVEVSYGNQTFKTPDQQFLISLNLPTAVLVDLPDEIVRDYIESEAGRVLSPGFVTLTAEYMFPDGYDRQLRSTRLYVDGEVFTENTQIPFEFFAWPLDSYLFSGEHLLSVEVEDILGFRSISPPVSILVTVESLYPAWLTASLKFLSSGGWVPLAIVAIGGTLITGLRIRRRRLRTLENIENGFEEIGYVDPLLQEIPGLSASNEGLLGGAESSPGGIGAQREIPPRLEWADSSPKPFAADVIHILNTRIVIGKDPGESGVVLNADSVSPQHAVLVRSDGGSVSIADLGSESGTWVNFAPVSSRGIILNQGDIVQIGKLKFRYQIGEGRSGNHG